MTHGASVRQVDYTKLSKLVNESNLRTGKQTVIESKSREHMDSTGAERYSAGYTHTSYHSRVLNSPYGANILDNHLQENYVQSKPFNASTTTKKSKKTTQIGGQSHQNLHKVKSQNEFANTATN